MNQDLVPTGADGPPAVGRFASLVNAVDLLMDAICIVDERGHYLYVSAAFEQIFGYAPDEVLGRQMLDLVHPDDRAITLQIVADIMAGHPTTHFENRYTRKDGRVVHIMWSARWVEADRVRIAVARDVTEHKRAEARRASLFAISEAAHAATDMLALFGRIHAIIGELLPACNFFVALYDRQRDVLSFPYYVDEHDAAPAPRPLDSGTLAGEVIQSGRPLLLTPSTRDAQGERKGSSVGTDPLDWLGVPLATPNGVIGALVVQSYTGDLRYTEDDMALLQFVSTQVASAIERKQLDEQLRHSALHDALTDLPNRLLFSQRLHAALDPGMAASKQVALLYIDLDDFKNVNDTLGHIAGDMLLQQVAQRLSDCVRGSDTVARIGGDEFVVLLNAIEPGDAIGHVADKIHGLFDTPFMLEDRQVRITASIGVASGPEGSDRFEWLLRHADAAMYEAKRAGGDRVRMVSRGENPGSG